MMSQKAEAAAQAQTAIAAVANKVTWFGSGGAILGGLSVQEAGVIAGVIIATLGFLVNWFYKHKAHKLKVKWYAENAPTEVRDY